MFCTCVNVRSMSKTKMIQIRNVPAELHRKLKMNAAERGMTLSDYLLSEIEYIAGKPTLAEWVDEVSKRPPVEVTEDVAVGIRRDRENM